MNYLNKIIENKRHELRERKKKLPLSQLKEMIMLNSRKPVSLSSGIRSQLPAVIAEIKRKSPSKGKLRNITDPGPVAVEYEKNGAVAISILTDSEFFGGSLTDLETVKKAVNIPVLRKDFILEPYQVYESGAIGADAFLIIAGCLDTGTISELLDCAEQLKLEALVETETADDIHKIADLPVKIVGINNRNLNTFHEDINKSIELVSLLPKETVKISESGIKDAEQMKKMSGSGFDGFLIGETLMRAEKPGKKLAHLIDEFRTL